MPNTKTLLLVLLLVALVFQIGGCTGKSQPTRFYTLTSMADDTSSGEEKSGTRDLSIGIGPVKLADYLTQSRIVTRTGANKIDQADFDQWSGSLQNNVSNVLADNIGRLLGTEKIVVHPWRSFMTIDYQVVVDIVRLDGQPGDEATLEARWIVLAGRDNSIIDIKRSTIIEATDAPGYASLAAAQSRALGRLSKEIALSIHEAAVK